MADDQEAINEAFGAILSSAGYEIKTTSHPSEVIALVAEFQPAVALISLIAPEIGGIRLSQMLSERFPTLKIVFVGENVKEEILQYLLEQNVNCDTLETPVETQELLDMMKTWVSGLSHIDPISRLRNSKDSKHLEVSLDRNFRTAASMKHELSVFFVQILQCAPSDSTLATEPAFLRALGTTLAGFAQLGPPYRAGESWFARFGFAYRNSESEFAILSAWVDRKQACEVSVQLKTEVDSLLKHHGLSHRFFVAVALVNAPEDALSGQMILEEGRRLIGILKETGYGGVAVRRLANRKRILVSYEEAINELFSEILSAAGHEVRTTTRPSAVLAVADEFKPDIALIKLVSEIDGLKLSEQLSLRFPGLKIVLLHTDSSFFQYEIVQTLLKSGVLSDTLELPCEREELLEKLDRL
ncbi:MAG TPA: response regulator [Candidatus Acidoferrum sp.]|nr:response regulator [Candidatus Acidoferrum sp.]